MPRPKLRLPGVSFGDYPSLDLVSFQLVYATCIQSPDGPDLPFMQPRCSMVEKKFDPVSVHK